MFPITPITPPITPYIIYFMPPSLALMRASMMCEFAEELRQVLVLSSLNSSSAAPSSSFPWTQCDESSSTPLLSQSSSSSFTEFSSFVIEDGRMVRRCARLAAEAGLLHHLDNEQRVDVIRAFTQRVRVQANAPVPNECALYVVMRGEASNASGNIALKSGDAYVGAGWPRVGEAGELASRVAHAHTGGSPLFAGAKGVEIGVATLERFEAALKHSSLRLALDASPALSTLPAKARGHLARNMEHEVFAPDALVFRQGDIGDRFYAILAGSVDVYVLNLSFDDDMDDETFDAVRELEEEAGRENEEEAAKRQRRRSSIKAAALLAGGIPRQEEDEELAALHAHMSSESGDLGEQDYGDHVHVPKFEELSESDLRRMSTERRVSCGVRRRATTVGGGEMPNLDERRKIRMFEREAQYGAHVATLGVGDCFGELALLRDDMRSATIVADVDIGCELAAVDRKRYLESVAYSRSLKGSSQSVNDRASAAVASTPSQRKSLVKPEDEARDGDTAGDGQGDEDETADESAGQSFSDVAIDILRTPIIARSIDDITKLEGLFSSFPFFARLPKQLRREVCKRLKFAHHETSSHVCEQGDPSNEFYVIIRGCLSVITDHHEVARLGPGEAVGETGLLKGAARGATLAAVSPTDLACLARDDYRRVLRRHDMTRIAESGRFLSQVSCWKDICPHSVLLRLAYQCRFHEYPNGHELVCQGESSCKNVHFLVKGSLELSTASANQPGGRLIEAMVGPGYAAGELQAIRHQVSDVSVRCYGPCKVLSLSGHDVVKKLPESSLQQVLAIANARVESRASRRPRCLKARKDVLRVLEHRDEISTNAPRPLDPLRMGNADESAPSIPPIPSPHKDKVSRAPPASVEVVTSSLEVPPRRQSPGQLRRLDDMLSAQGEKPTLDKSGWLSASSTPSRDGRPPLARAQSTEPRLPSSLASVTYGRVTTPQTLANSSPMPSNSLSTRFLTQGHRRGLGEIRRSLARGSSPFRGRLTLLTAPRFEDNDRAAGTPPSSTPTKRTDGQPLRAASPVCLYPLPIAVRTPSPSPGNPPGPRNPPRNPPRSRPWS